MKTFKLDNLRMTVTLDPDTWNQIHCMAAELNISVSAAIRLLIHQEQDRTWKAWPPMEDEDENLQWRKATAA